MEEIIVWEQNHGTLPNSINTKQPDLAQRAHVLKDLALALLNEVETLGDDGEALNGADAIDFYDEVRRFEIELITRALKQTGGHQMRAARLLNVKVTTLNSKIKRYNIDPESQLLTYPITQSTVEEFRKRA
jgi:transcriptional regulator with GAF, ATPase, and Fis domain